MERVATSITTLRQGPGALIMKSEATELPAKNVKYRLSCKIVFPGPLCRLCSTKSRLAMDCVCIQVSVTLCPGVGNGGCVGGNTDK